VMNGKDDFEEILLHGISGIKKFIKQKIILPYDKKKGVVSDVKGGKWHVPGQGIVEGARKTEVILDCGHPASFGLGHVAECGHVVCKLCVQRYALVCAYPGCFRNLCRVKGCSNSARMMSGVYFCKKHQFSEAVATLSNLLFLGRRRTQGIIDEVKQEYYSTFLPEKKKELTNGRQNFPGKSGRTLGFSEKTRHVERRNPGNIP